MKFERERRALVEVDRSLDSQVHKYNVGWEVSHAKSHIRQAMEWLAKAEKVEPEPSLDEMVDQHYRQLGL